MKTKILTDFQTCISAPLRVVYVKIFSLVRSVHNITILSRHTRESVAFKMLIYKSYIHGGKQHRGIVGAISNICYEVFFVKSSYKEGSRRCNSSRR